MSRWTKALKLETNVARIIHQQEKNGVEFDLPKANRHIKYLQDTKDAIYKKVRPYLATEVVNPYTVEVKEPFLKAGGYCQAVSKWYTEEIPDIGGPFSRVGFVNPDIGSRQKLQKQLLSHGWIPDLYTEKGSPKLTDKGEPVPSLMRIKAPIGKDLARWFVLNHRQSQIQGWINRIRPDGRLTAGANSCGTNTARMRHRVVVNVPKAKESVIFGYEMRDLFITRDGYRLVGHDAAGLEARMMAHYTSLYDGGVFAEEILNGDIHTKNAITFFATELQGRIRGDEGFEYYRDLAKTLFYGIIYGAQAPKVASTIGKPVKEGAKVFNAFWDNSPGLKKLRSRVIALSDKNGWVPGLDGRKIYTRSSHSALNAVFQSAGAIVMKSSMVILDHLVERSGLDVVKVIDMHDESQAEVPDKDIRYTQGTKEEVMESTKGRIWTPPHLESDGTYTSMYTRYGELAVKSIRMAGIALELRCDLDADYMIGNSWAETH